MTDIARFYDRLADKHGATPKAVDAYGQNSLNARYEVLSEVCHLDGRSVLDVGCNYGGLGAYLRDRGRLSETNYTGIDISKKAIEVGKKENPDLNLNYADLETYWPMDILTGGQKQFDVVLAQGIFYKLPNTPEGGAKIIELISHLARLSKFALAFTSVWHGGRPDKIPGVNWLEPAPILAFLLTMTPWVSLKTDYMDPDDADFCCYAYKEKP